MRLPTSFAPINPLHPRPNWRCSRFHSLARLGDTSQVLARSKKFARNTIVPTNMSLVRSAMDIGGPFLITIGNDDASLVPELYSNCAGLSSGFQKDVLSRKTVSN